MSNTEISNDMNINYYKIFDENYDKALENKDLKNNLKQMFCHHAYRNRFLHDDKFIFYCNFFELDIEYMKTNHV